MSHETSTKEPDRPTNEKPDYSPAPGVELDALERMTYNHLVRGSPHLAAIRMVFDTVEGDFSQLSPGLFEFASARGWFDEYDDDKKPNAGLNVCGCEHHMENIRHVCAHCDRFDRNPTYWLGTVRVDGVWVNPAGFGQRKTQEGAETDAEYAYALFLGGLIPGEVCDGRGTTELAYPVFS